jgi:outer membrane protein assembly factor BamB
MLYALDAATGRPLWSHPGTGVSGPVVGADGEIYVASNASPYLCCLDPGGNGDGTTEVLFAYRMGDRVLESVPCLYGGKLFILSCDGWLHAVE